MLMILAGRGPAVQRGAADADDARWPKEGGAADAADDADDARWFRACG